MKPLREVMDAVAWEPAEGEPCPACGSRPMRLRLPWRPERELVVGGAGRCLCQQVAAHERQMDDLQARARRRVLEDLRREFFACGRVGETLRRVRLGDLRPLPGQEEAWGHLQRLAKSSPGQRGVALWGAAGAGKTLLAAALLNERWERGETSLFVSVPGLLLAMRRAWDDPDARPESWYLAQIGNAQWVLLDDLAGATAWGTDRLYLLVDALWQQRARVTVLLTSNLPAQDLERRLGDRADAILSRLAELCGWPWVQVRTQDQRLLEGRRR